MALLILSLFPLAYIAEFERMAASGAILKVGRLKAAWKKPYPQHVGEPKQVTTVDRYLNCSTVFRSTIGQSINA